MAFAIVPSTHIVIIVDAANMTLLALNGRGKVLKNFKILQLSLFYLMTLSIKNERYLLLQRQSISATSPPRIFMDQKEGNSNFQKSSSLYSQT